MKRCVVVVLSDLLYEGQLLGFLKMIGYISKLIDLVFKEL